METLKFGFKFFKKSMVLSVIAEILSFLGIFAELMLPLLSGMLIDYVIKEGTVTEESGGAFHFLLSGKFGAVHTMELFFSVAIVYTILILLRIILIYIRDLIQEWVGLRLETELRYETYGKLMELDSATIADYNSGELLQILNSDTIMFKELFSHRIPYLGDAIFMLITTLVLITSINVSFLIVPLILMPFLVITVLNFKKQARMNFKMIRQRSSEMNLNVQENIAAVRIVRSFTNEELEKEKFQTANTNFVDARLKQIWLSSKFDLTFNAIKQIAYISTIVIGAILVIRGDLTVGYILTSSTYVMRIMHQITGLNNIIFNMQQQTIAGVELKKFMENWREVMAEEEIAGSIVSAATLEELAEKLEINKEEFLQNIADYNESTRHPDPNPGPGGPPPMMDDDDEGGMPPMFGPPQPKKPIEKGPFYAIKLKMFHENAIGGMTIDHNAAVLKGGKPIPGLFAAGDTTRGIMIPGDVGVGYVERTFSALTQALNEGYIAGVAAAKYI